MEPALDQIQALTEDELLLLHDDRRIELLGWKFDEECDLGSTSRRRGALRSLWLQLQETSQPAIPEGRITIEDSQKQLDELRKRTAQVAYDQARASGIEKEHIVEALASAGLSVPETTMRVTVQATMSFDLPVTKDRYEITPVSELNDYVRLGAMRFELDRHNVASAHLGEGWSDEHRSDGDEDVHWVSGNTSVIVTHVMPTPENGGS